MAINNFIFTFLQISQLALHGRCSWILASPRDVAWPHPSSGWRYMPASHVLRWAPTPPASRWARPRCPTDACGTERNSCQSQLGQSVTRIYLATHPFISLSVLLGLISVNTVQHGRSELQVPAELLQVHDAPVHLLQDPLQPDNTQTHTGHTECTAQLLE